MPAKIADFAADRMYFITILVKQPKGKELEYRTIAVNKAGDGEPSNTEMVVL